MLALAVLQIAALPTNPSYASLVSEAREVRPGSSFEVALRFRMYPGWHIYWRNPGEAGQAPTVAWHLPKRWRAGPIEWPTPARTDSAGIVTYTYHDGTLLLTKITVPAEAPNGPVALKGTVKWLVCREGCVPAHADVTATLAVGPREVRDSIWSARLAAAKGRVPVPDPGLGLNARRWNDEIRLSFRDRLTPSQSSGNILFLPADDAIDPSAAQTATSSGDTRVLQLKIASYAPKNIERLRGLLVFSPNKSDKAIAIDIPIQRTTP